MVSYHGGMVEQTTQQVPPGWPADVQLPGSADWAESAVAWLLEVVPPQYRKHAVLRRNPVALAALARHHADACVEGARQGYRNVRAELGKRVPSHVVDGVLVAYRTEGTRLVATSHAVELVERALLGELPRTAN
jgi:hypothetical protein